MQSWRGRSGGYALLKAASDISFGQVLRIIDGPLAPLPCVSGLAYRKCTDCQDEASCALKRVFAMSHRATVAVLDQNIDRRCPEGRWRARRWLGQDRATGFSASRVARSEPIGVGAA